MNFEVPREIRALLAELDAFIEREILPLEREHIQYFDHRREWARTDWEAGGRPHPDWEAVLGEMRRRADAAGYLRYALPPELGGRGGSHLAMAMIREHLAHRGLGLHNDLQNESSIVGNFPVVHMLHHFGSPEQQKLLEGMIRGEVRVGFGLTEPDHGSDATWLETRAVRRGSGPSAVFAIDGAKRFNSGLHNATHDLIFARTGGEPGDPRGITCFLVPTDTRGFAVKYLHWTFNMPSDHAEVELRGVTVPASAVVHREGEGLVLAQFFIHENRVRQAASGVGAAQYCIDESVRYARARKTWGEPLARRQAIQFPLAELHSECEMVRNLVYKTAWLLDRQRGEEISHLVSMVNYRANRLVCEAADRAMQVHGGMGYTRHKPFEHIYRHHRRYRITEGSEEIQLRRVAGQLFGFTGGRRTRTERGGPG